MSIVEGTDMAGFMPGEEMALVDASNEEDKLNEEGNKTEEEDKLNEEEDKSEEEEDEEVAEAEEKALAKDLKKGMATGFFGASGERRRPDESRQEGAEEGCQKSQGEELLHASFVFLISI